MSKLQSDTALKIVEDLLLTETPANMRENLRKLMDNYFLNNEEPDRDSLKSVYSTFSALDRALKTLDERKLNQFDEKN